MHKQRILVSAVGFTDIERHALNTVFRLSQERELAYEPWVPPNMPSANPPIDEAQVILVDDDCAEAVLFHVRPPEGPRLIWVGDDPPAHAWRVWKRPIDWAEALMDLDSVFVAHQVDSGLLDLDVSLPAGLTVEEEQALPGGDRRALIVAPESGEASCLRECLALAAVRRVDEADTTEGALELMARHRYVCGVFNLDNHQVDGWALMRLFVERQPQAMTLAASQWAGPVANWWTRRRMRRSAEQVGTGALLPRPLTVAALAPWMELL